MYQKEFTITEHSDPAVYFFLYMTNGVEVADGSVSMSQGLLSMGESAVVSAATFGAGELGTAITSSMGGVTGAMVGAAASTAITSSTQQLMSGLQLSADGGLKYSTKTAFSAKGWENAGLQVLTATAAAGAVASVGELEGYNESTTATADEKTAYQNFNQSGTAQMIQGGVQTIGNEVKNYTTASKGSQQGFWNVAAQGAATTIGNYVGQQMANGIDSEMGANGGLALQQLTSAVCRSALDAGMGQNSSINWAGVAKVDPLAQLQNSQTWDAAHQSPTAQSSSTPLQDTADMDYKDTLLGGLWTGLKNAGSAVSNFFQGVDNSIKAAGAAIGSGLVAGANYLFGPSAAELSSNAALAQQAKQDAYNKTFDLQSLNSAKNHAETGSYYTGDENASMADLLTKVNDAMGLEGDQRITTAATLQTMVQQGLINRQDVESIVSSSLQDSQQASFNNSYNTANAQNAGTVVASNGAYVNKNTGQVVSTMWHNGTAEANPVPVPTSADGDPAANAGGSSQIVPGKTGLLSWAMDTVRINDLNSPFSNAAAKLIVSGYGAVNGSNDPSALDSNDPVVSEMAFGRRVATAGVFMAGTLTAADAIPTIYGVATTTATTAAANATAAATTVATAVGTAANYLSTPAGQDALTETQMMAAFYENSLVTNPIQTIQGTMNMAVLQCIDQLPTAASQEFLEAGSNINYLLQGAINYFTPGVPDYEAISTPMGGVGFLGSYIYFEGPEAIVGIKDNMSVLKKQMRASK